MPELSETATIADVAHVRALLLAAARDGEVMSYSGLLNQLGLRFTRPKMRALCRTLDRIDEDGRARSEPGLAVLVVREGDGLPGQGWWVDHAHRTDYAGAWAGGAAVEEVRRLQRAVFRYWATPRARGRSAGRKETGMADEDQAEIAKAFHDAVNMTPAVLEKWLATPESKEVGWKGPDGKGSGESVGHKEGERIVAILRKKQAELDDADVADMKKVTGYVHRHLAQGGPAEDKEHSRWRYSLMNWGHDPLK